MRRTLVLVAVLALAAPVLAGPSMPSSNTLEFTQVAFTCGGSTPIQLTNAPLGTVTVTVKNITTGEPKEILLTNGSGTLTGLPCNGDNDLVYVLYKNGSATNGEVMVLNQGAGTRASGSNGAANLFIATDKDPLDCTTDATVDFLIVDGNDPADTAQGTVGWTQSETELISTPAPTDSWGISPNRTNIYDFSIGSLTGGNNTDTSYECNPAVSTETFTYTSPTTGNPTVSASGHEIVPVQLQSFDAN